MPGRFFLTEGFADVVVAPRLNIAPGQEIWTITCAPSSDVRDIHHRMGVILEKTQLAEWMEGEDGTTQQLLSPFPDGRLLVEKANDVDWGAAPV